MTYIDPLCQNWDSIMWKHLESKTPSIMCQAQRQNKSATVCRLWGSVTHQKMNQSEVGENLVFCSISSSWIIPDFCLVCLQEANSSTQFFLEDFILEMLWNVQLYLQLTFLCMDWIKRKMWFACLASEIRHGKVKTFSTSALKSLQMKWATATT